MPDQFPKLRSPTKAKWAPVFLSPIMGAPEKLVIGIAAVSANEFHLERANALRRLECLYGKAAATAIFAAEVALEELRADLAIRGIEALSAPKPTFSGISIGTLADGEANSVQEVARSWMISSSSLYDTAQALSIAVEARALAAPSEGGAVVTDRLPSLVLNYVAVKRPGLREFFNEDIRDERRRRRHSKAHSVIIDYAGSHLVANFGTMAVTQPTASVDKIKRRIFDLLIDRDTEKRAIAKRRHEMIVQHPDRDDPQITERQFDAVEEAIASLSDQAQREEIVLIASTSVSKIGDHILETEQRIQ